MFPRALELKNIILSWFTSTEMEHNRDEAEESDDSAQEPDEADQNTP